MTAGHIASFGVAQLFHVFVSAFLDRGNLHIEV